MKTKINSVKIILCALIILMGSSGVIADFILISDVYSPDAKIILVSPLNGTSWSTYNLTDSPSNTLEILQNTGTIRFNADTNKTIEDLTYAPAIDSLIFKATGANGYLNTSLKSTPGIYYYLYINSVFNSKNLSDINGWSTFNNINDVGINNFFISSTNTSPALIIPNLNTYNGGGSGGGVGSGSAHDTRIFKCDYTNITVSYTLPVTNSRVVINNIEYTMIPDDPSNLNWHYLYGGVGYSGSWNLRFIFNYGGIDYSQTTTALFVVYSDKCIGTVNTWNSTNLSTYGNMGNRTNKLFSGEQDLLDFVLSPYILFFGYSIYIIFMFVFSGLIYMKTQSVAAPLLTGTLSIWLVMDSGYLPTEYKVILALIIAVGIAAILSKLTKS